jgi:hypothetical protein
VAVGTASLKGKVQPRRGHEGPEGKQKYISTLSRTSALDGGDCSRPRSDRFVFRKETRYPLCRRLDGPQGRSGQLRKISLPRGCVPRTVQHATIRNTDYATPAHADSLNRLTFLVPHMTYSTHFLPFSHTSQHYIRRILVPEIWYSTFPPDYAYVS